MTLIMLQWGHRLSAVETGHRLRDHPDPGHASMEPPPFGSGNRPPAQGPSGSGPRFNGATAFRQWKPCTILGADANSSKRFNGATAFRRWKREIRRHSGRHNYHHSMGPPPFGDGNGTPYSLAAVHRSTLQWGHRLSAMETAASLKIAAGVKCLQWGHRLSAMETPPAPHHHRECLGAFNGATAFRRWKPELDPPVPRL